MASPAYPYLRESTPAYLGVLVPLCMVGIAIGLGYSVALGDIGAFWIALSVVASLAVLFDFRIGAVLLIVLMPLGTTNFVPHGVMGVPGLNPVNVLILATLASYVAHGGRLRELIPRPFLWLMMVPILLAGLMGMAHVDEIADIFFDEEALFTTPAGYFRELAVRPLLLPLVGLLAGAALARSQTSERVLIPIMVATWTIGLLMIAFIAASGVHLGHLASPASRQFFNEMGLHANQLGRLFAVAYALLLFVWWETKRPALKTALFITLGIASLGVVLSFSRGGLFGFMVVNAAFLAWKFNARTVGLAVLAGAITVALAPDYLWSRITFGFEADANAVSADRIEGIWLPLLPELWKSPLWGSGLGSIMWSAPMLTGSMLPTSHPHNAYLEALLDMGAIGLVVMLAFYFHVWRGFRRLGSSAYLTPEMRAFFQGATAALICFLVTGGAGSSFRPEEEFSFLWLAIGMMYGTLARKPPA